MSSCEPFATVVRFKQNWNLLIICQLNSAVSVFFKIHSVVLELLYTDGRADRVKEGPKGSFLQFLVANTPNDNSSMKYISQSSFYITM